LQQFFPLLVSITQAMAGTTGLGAASSNPAEAVRQYCAGRYANSGAAQYGITLEQLGEIVAEVIAKAAPADDELPHLLNSLKLPELVLARACEAGSDTAWETFLVRYRATLYGAAQKIVGDDATAHELADGIYAELYGVSETGHERVSKFRYYSGRGSLEGWLRTVVAQGWIDRKRRERKQSSLEEMQEQGKDFAAAGSADVRIRDTRVDAAVRSALGETQAEERLLLSLYYLDGRTLAQIGSVLRVHESTASRRLERATTDLRKRVRRRLIQAGMSSAQADEAMEVDARDLNVDVRKSLGQESAGAPFYQERRESSETLHGTPGEEG
jgi:RNA polymerase sigma-70 factor, ECF subfamily